jgi:hypothetical protein
VIAQIRRPQEEATVSDATQAPGIVWELRVEEAIRCVVRRAVAEHPDFSDEQLLALAQARLLEDPASRADVCAALLALAEDGDG